MIRLIFLFSVIFFVQKVSAQETMLVYLKDKAQEKPLSFTERSVNRRVKNNVVGDEKDIPVAEEYLNELEVDVVFLGTSRWLNAVAIETDLSEIQLMEKYDFIDRITVIGKGKPRPRKDLIDVIEAKATDYGNADTQVRQINANCLHDRGFTGNGIYLAVIDAGFKGMDTIPYFDSIYLENRVIDRYNFIDNNTDIYNFSSHGTSVSSTIFAEKLAPQAHIGTAVDVDIALYVSEDVSSETLIEEFYLVTALERCDVQGVDVANISLGYFEFDDPNENHVYADLDGQTTVAAIGVNTAASKGIVVVIAAGNSGPNFISTPCDSDSCLCVGGIDGFENYAPFSSIGPAADGQIKPDVVARGMGTWVITDSGQLASGNGTSFATPVTTGAVACLIEANPTATVAEIIQGIRESANQFLTPDQFIGYGIPDFCLADDLIIDVTGVEENEGLSNVVEIYPNPTTGKFIVTSKNDLEIEIYTIYGQRVNFSTSETQNKTQIDISDLPSAVYLIKINSSVSRVIKRD